MSRTEEQKRKRAEREKKQRKEKWKELAKYAEELSKENNKEKEDK